MFILQGTLLDQNNMGLVDLLWNTMVTV